jgi:cation:H+ antiporter
VSRSAGFTWIGLALLACSPGVLLRLTGTHISTVVDTALFGVAIVAAAFLLSWTAEAAELDISQGLAVAIVALIAVLPEYAVDLTFAWKAGTDPSFAPFAVANMTGANRLLVGGAWPLVALIFWWRSRKTVLELDRPQSVEVLALMAATVYSFTIPLKGTIHPIDAVVLGALFIGYVWIVGRAHSEAPELVGPARTLGDLPRTSRRTGLILLFVLAAGAVLAAAEPFAEGLIHTGTSLGIDEFLLVQWLAPLASEAPEFLVAGILAYRLRAAAAMRLLLSSKVNQWTLLIGGLAVAFSISNSSVTGLVLDERQTEELYLTAAQSLFAVAVLSSLTFSGREAILLFSLFAIQFIFPSSEVRWVITGTYLALSVLIVIMRLTDLRVLWQNAVLTIREAGAGNHEHEPETARSS